MTYPITPKQVIINRDPTCHVEPWPEQVKAQLADLTARLDAQEREIQRLRSQYDALAAYLNRPIQRPQPRPQAGQRTRGHRSRSRG